MKSRMILSFGLLTFLVSWGNSNASAFDLFRFAAEEAAVEAPAALEETPALEEGEFKVGQKDCGGMACEPWCTVTPWNHCLAKLHCAKMNLHSRLDACHESLKTRTCMPRFCAPATCWTPDCSIETKGEVCQKGGPTCQQGCEPFGLPCRPRMRGWGKADCEPACGVEVKGEACQKGCGPASQKACEPFAQPCRPRLWGWNMGCWVPACGVEVKEEACQKDCGPVSQKGCEPFALPCRHRVRGMSKSCGEFVCVESKGQVTYQKNCSGAEQKDPDEGMEIQK